MATSVVMPETGTVLKWYRAEGDAVRVGDHLCDVETDKTVLEIEAEAEGILQRILVPEGASDVEAQSELAVIAPAGEAGEPEAAAQAKDTTPQRARVVELSAAGAAGVPAPEVRGAGGRDRIFASPLARRLARESGVVLEEIAGSGPGGRIVERDVSAALRVVASGARPQRPAGGAPEHPGGGDGFRGADAFEVLPLSGMRRTIAQRLVESKRTIPHFYLSADVELGALVELRRRIAEDLHDADGEPRHRISINDFVVKALALALREVPAANLLWGEDRILRPRNVDIGVATAIDDGLLTPVVRDADRKSLASISDEIRTLAARARDRALSSDEYQGGTSTVSNLGMYGVKEFAAIINPPQSSILSVGAASQRVIVRDGVPAVETVLSMTLACDHRVVDGVTGASLLAVIKRLLEKPIGLML